MTDPYSDPDAAGPTLPSRPADTAADRLRLEVLHQVVEEWEADHGVISAAELDALEHRVAEARRRAALTQAPPARPGDPGPG
jgi:hypothetical protein